MLIQGQVGPITATSSIGAGLQAPIRQGNMGEQVITNLHGKHYEATYRRSCFSISNQAATGITTTVALATTFIGICVGNPAASTVNLVMQTFGYAFTVAPAAPLVLGLMTGVGAITGTVTPRNRYIGGATGQAVATLGGTIPTPVVEMILGTPCTQLAVASWNPQLTPTVFNFEGQVILPPNTFIASYTNIAGGASGFFGSFSWEECPI
jgi:hypothetical protein